MHGPGLPEAAASSATPCDRHTSSRNEWVRFIALAGTGCLLVATNRGLLHRVQLPAAGREERWEMLYRSSRRAPITCLAQWGAAVHKIATHPMRLPALLAVTGSILLDFCS